jgi:hypothetical protein
MQQVRENERSVEQDCSLKSWKGGTIVIVRQHESFQLGSERKSDKKESTAYAVPIVFTPLQKHCFITRKALQFHLKNGSECS